MPELGEIQRVKNAQGFMQKYEWRICIDCKQGRWSEYPKPPHRCLACENKRKKDSGENYGPRHVQWKGGRRKRGDGYIQVWVAKDDFFFKMATTHGCVLEHRLLMARHLQRCLLPWEIVHHINGIRDDNRLENLQLLPGSKYHVVDTMTKRRIKILEARVTQLEAENALLKLQGAEYGR